MTELFENISPEVKRVTEGAWNLTIAQRTPAEAAKLLNTITEYYRLIFTPEEVDFLQFYFKMKIMEMSEE